MHYEMSFFFLLFVKGRDITKHGCNEFTPFVAEMDFEAQKFATDSAASAHCSRVSHGDLPLNQLSLLHFKIVCLGKGD
jgi:hypothetical protein